MVRWYDPDRPVPVEVIDTALSNAIRARVQGSARTGTSSYPSPVSSPHRPGHQRVHPFLCSASGSFLACSFLGGKRAGQGWFSGLLGVLPKSSLGGVGGESEEVVEAFLGGVGVGEDALGSGPAFVSGGVEQDGLLDPGEVGQ